MITDIAVLASPATAFVPYYTSLKRTEPKERTIWKLLTGVGFALSVILAFAALGMPVAGAVAVALIPVWLLCFCAFGVEVNNVIEGGVHDYRQLSKPAPQEPFMLWEPEARITEDSDDVELIVRRGSFDRIIGSADPLTELDNFYALEKKAEEAAALLNQLSVKSVSKAVAVRNPHTAR